MICDKRAYKKEVARPRLNFVGSKLYDGYCCSEVIKEHLSRHWSWRLQESIVDPPHVQPPVLRNFMSLRPRLTHSVGTDRSGEEADEDGESENKFIANAERLLSIATPLEVDSDTKDDEEDSVEEGLENETEQNRRR